MSEDKQHAENLGSSVGSTALLPCPFCGSENVYLSEDDYGFARWVSCDDCETTGPVLAVQPGTKEAAVSLASRKWNNRRANGLVNWLEAESAKYQEALSRGPVGALDAKCQELKRCRKMVKRLMGQ